MGHQGVRFLAGGISQLLHAVLRPASQVVWFRYTQSDVIQGSTAFRQFQPSDETRVCPFCPATSHRPSAQVATNKSAEVPVGTNCHWAPSELVRRVPLRPTASKRLSPNASPSKSAVVPLSTVAHWNPFADVRIVPCSPSASQPLEMEHTARRFGEIPNWILSCLLYTSD